MDLKDKSTKKNRYFSDSFNFAAQGIKTAYKEERNMRKHTVFAGIALIAGLVFQLMWYEWLWLMLAIFMVLIVEIINTAFENVVDMFTNYHFHDIGKKIKDMAAGAVLLTACFAVIVGAVIFIPKVYELIISFL